MLPFASMCFCFSVTRPLNLIRGGKCDLVCVRSSQHSDISVSAVWFSAQILRFTVDQFPKQSQASVSHWMKISLCGLNINGVVHQRTCKCTLQMWVGTVKDCRQFRWEQQQTWCSYRRRQMNLDHICSGVSHNIRRVFGLKSIVPSSPVLEREGQEALVNIVTPYFRYVCHNVMLTGHLDMQQLINELINGSMSVT